MFFAFLIGFFGSFHCVGMCGSLNLMLVNSIPGIFYFYLYHLGRILTYVLLGLVLGLVFKGMYIFSIQEFFSILFGVFLILIHIVPKLKYWVEYYFFKLSPLSSIRTKMDLFTVSKHRKWFVFGLLNGFLPCGLIYVGIANTFMVTSIHEKILYMFLFGVGTFPALWLLSIIGVRLTRGRFYFNMAMKVIGVFTGMILLLRGLIFTSPNLDYLVRTHASTLIPLCGI